MQTNFIIVYVIMFIGFSLIVFSGVKLYSQKVFVDNAQQATGVITAYHYTDGTRIQRSQDTASGFAGRVDITNASPVIEFTTKSGETVEFISTSSSDSSISEDVQLLYNEDAPELAKLNEFFSLWGWIYIILGFGVIIMVVGFVIKLLL